MNLLESEEGLNLRKKIYRSMVYVQKDRLPYPTQEYTQQRNMVDKGVAKIYSSMTRSERNDLNAAYLVYLRMVGKLDTSQAKIFNYIYPAIKWRIINEFSPKENSRP